MKSQFQNSTPSFLSAIRDRLPELHRAEKRLGLFLLDFPGELAAYDAQELARLSGVSKATVSRFVRKIGFENYETARRTVRAEQRTGTRRFLAHADADPADDLLPVGLQEEWENIAWTFDRIDTADLDAVADAILGARKVWLAGYRINRCFAEYVHWQLTKVVADTAIIPQAGESLGEYLAAMQPEDLVIWFALRRRAANTDLALKELERLGPSVVLISDEGMEPRSLATWHFRTRIQVSSPQFNHASVLSLSHQIVTRATLRAGPEANMRLREIDNINERLGEV